MQIAQYILKTLVCLTITGYCPKLVAQSVFLPQGDKQYLFLDRLQIKLGGNPDLNLSADRPFSRRLAMNAGLLADSLHQAGALNLSASDKRNLQSLLINNSEWYPGTYAPAASRKPFLNAFYKTKANLFEVNEKDFFLAVNPVLQLQQSVENDHSERVFLNTRGLTLRGMIARKVGFYTYLAENQERPPLFVGQYIAVNRAVPGAGFYKTFKTTGFDYLDARGGITFNAAKFIDFQFAYDRNFIGNGYRSLLLSDFSNNYLFLKINTRVWKINYQNVFMELNPQFVRTGDNLLDKKYAAMHHLSVNATKWLTLGLFEAVIFGRKNRFDFMYLNPIIFLRAAEQQNGSPDNAIIGFDAKANIGRRAQVYSQILLDEFLLKEVRAGNGWWGNKFGVQLGAKYIDVFNVPNLDVQGELNVVRPFTYSHYDSSANYSHYNQPLAHPLGANFIEAIGIVRYQPVPRLFASARLIYWRQGLDSGVASLGSNIFKLYTTRPGEYGFGLPNGVPSRGFNAQLLASYELRENLFIDASVLLRRLRSEIVIQRPTTSVLTLGLRMNMHRREYDY
jgi:hypothetical protein